jgi:hypothetical protein
MEKMDLYSFVLPNKVCSSYQETLNYLNMDETMRNKYVFLIIEKLYVTIVIPYNIAFKFRYIGLCFEMNDYKKKNNYYFVTVPYDWDTRGWKYTDIITFHENFDGILNGHVSNAFLDGLIWVNDDLD